MPDPFLAAFTITLGIATAPVDTSGDPGASSECPNDMRLVAGDHCDEVEHYCLEPKKDTKDTHCYSYWEGVTALAGTETEIKVCMDRYEAPNQKGVEPFVMKSYESGKKWCEERHKRMCTEQEW